MTIEDFFVELDHYFLSEEKLDFPITLAEERRQNENWFKSELHGLFSSMKSRSELFSFEPEFPLRKVLPQLPNETRPSQQKIDFLVTLDQLLTPTYLEIKCIYWGARETQNWNWAYFDSKPSRSSNRPKGFIADDVRKLAKIKHGQRFCILFVYPSPEPIYWKETVDEFIEQMKPVEVSQHSFTLERQSEHLYIAKLKVSYVEG